MILYIYESVTKGKQAYSLNGLGGINPITILLKIF